MILQSLCAYYKQLEESHASELPQYGYELKEIQFIIVIGKNGNFIDIQDNRYSDGKNKKCKSFFVPLSKKRSGTKSYESCNCLWDNYEYILGVNNNNGQRKLESFCKQTELILSETNDEEVEAVVRFLQNKEALNELRHSIKYNDILKTKNCNIAFKLSGKERLICQNKSVQEYVVRHIDKDEEKEGLCLITGQKSKICRLHKNIYGICSKPAAISSFNDEAFESYGQKQGYNSPISILADFQFSSALNYLLRKESKQKLSLDGTDTKIVFWTDKKSSYGDLLFGLLRDDETYNATESIKSLYASIKNGIYIASDNDIQIYVLGLKPNGERILVKFWFTGQIRDIAKNILLWLDDIRLNEHSYTRVRLNDIIKSTCNKKIKDDGVKYSSIYENTFRAILQGAPLPTSLAKNAINRIRAEQGKIGDIKAALLKAYLNRRFRTIKKKEMPMSLNIEDNRDGYLLGRLFAVLEKLQKEVNPNLNATIKDRFFASSCINPKSVFTTLMRLHIYHMQKLNSPDKKIYYSRMISEIMDKLKDVPRHLDLDNQCLFCMGYYHQQKKLYSKGEQL